MLCMVMAVLGKNTKAYCISLQEVSLQSPKQVYN